jgi:dual specificity tyrosine-phosphorylation-regulated kinase 2/3/4
MLAYEIKPKDTWIFYELCGDSLGTNLYDLKGENSCKNDSDRIYRVIII